MSNAEILSAAAGADPSKETDASRDEDFSKAFTPVVQLAEVETKTGEEDEEVIFKIRAKLFRFSQDSSEWKERGTGDVRLLQHTTNGKIRLLMRREKTLKICMNQFVNPLIELKENVGSDRSWMWNGVDYADGERDEALLAIRFRDSTNAGLFKEAYDKARGEMKEKKAGSNGKATGEEKEAAAKEEVKEEAKVEKKEEVTEEEKVEKKEETAAEPEKKADE